MKHYIIGISGRIGAGKDTLSTMLYRFFTAMLLTCRIDSFAEPIRCIARDSGLWDGKRQTKEVQYMLARGATKAKIKMAVAAHLGNSDIEQSVVRRMVYWLDSQNWTVSPREFMQRLGYEAREMKPDYWRDKLVQRHHAFCKGHGSPVVTLVPDVRYMNEVQVTDLELFIKRIDSLSSKDSSEALANDSEFIEQCDHVFSNNGSLEDLATQAGIVGIGVAGAIRKHQTALKELRQALQG